MKLHRILPLGLAAALQVLPISRVTTVTQAVAPAGFAVIIRCAAGIAALLGGTDAVSGASSAISGLANLSPPGPLTLNATGTVNAPFAYRIVVSNPGSDHAQDYFDYFPPVPGLTINTNMGGDGRILGTPTTAGVYPVTLAAANDNYKSGGNLIWVYKDVTITIDSAGGGTKPTFTTQPQSQTVNVGDPVVFTALADGDPTPTYQWQKGGQPIDGATNTTYSIASAATSDDAEYTVVATNASGSTTSDTAILTVLSGPIEIRLTIPTLTGQGVEFDVTGPANSSCIVWRSADLSIWTPLSTNATGTGTFHFLDPDGLGGPVVFYHSSLNQ